VIRLRPRVGLSRTLSVSVLVAGLAGGVLISDRQTQHRTTADIPAAQAASLPRKDARDAPQGSQDDADQQNAQSKADDAATVAAAQAKAANDAARTSPPASRSDTRTTTGGSVGAIPASVRGLQRLTAPPAARLMLQKGFTIDQAPCLVNLWNRESGWNPSSSNKSSGAYGIPQAVPGSKMQPYGDDWRTKPGHPDQVGPGLHQGPLQDAVRCLVALPVDRLVLRLELKHT